MKYLLIALSLILSACASEPDHNFYSYYGGYQVITGEPMHLKPLGWGGSEHTEFVRHDLSH
jgi:hypothetical protein